jgi:hypothetical protein
MPRALRATGRRVGGGRERRRTEPALAPGARRPCEPKPEVDPTRAPGPRGEPWRTRAPGPAHGKAIACDGPLKPWKERSARPALRGILVVE